MTTKKTTPKITQNEPKPIEAKITKRLGSLEFEVSISVDATNIPKDQIEFVQQYLIKLL